MAYQKKKKLERARIQIKISICFFFVFGPVQSRLLLLCIIFFGKKKNSLHEALSAKCGSNIRDYKLLDAIKHPKRGRYDGKYTQGDSF